ncbi:MAG: hypothetical protein CR959_01025 [Fusobacteriales bacterium]|nr:MAG: hypothetical protein CR959_01025 [Fusobacteriales bacterium]
MTNLTQILWSANPFIQIIAAIITTISFGVLFNIKNKNLILTGIAGGISWAVYLLGLNLKFSDGLNYFIATLSLAIFAEIMSKKFITPATTILIPALIPLAPGGGIYYTMYNLINKNYPLALEHGISTFIIAGSMAVGVFTASSIIKIYDNIKK